ncbi:hypothetical protein [Streptomyces sp. CC77]|uniref:hypothetical protein n=1 Tax=Streptomyces sp. CC77 TaxID=1906739 RepID=UPI0008DCC1A2|nr:hypothetical protein [Streptomyces sp. CC77]OII69643.1 hypothetical protein BJP39_16810 [Streptomyces sp. CC77]
MTTSFALERTHVRRTLDWSGTSEEFGEITVCTATDLAPRDGAGVRVQGSAIPTALLTGFSLFEADPRLTAAELWLAGAEVPLRRNRWAVSRRQRALRLTYGEISYRCTAASRKEYTVTRPGLSVTVTESGFRRRRRRLLVLIDGPAEPADISLAVLFSRVNRSQLTWGGALRAGLSTAFFFWAESPAQGWPTPSTPVPLRGFTSDASGVGTFLDAFDQE